MRVNFKSKKIIKELLSVILVVFLGVVLRLVPHPPNFAPIGAISLFSGVYFMRRYFFIIPLITMLLSDYFIGFYDIKIMASVYFSFVIISLLGLILKRINLNFVSVSLFSFVSSLLFYFITNFAVWLFTPMYSKDIGGLILCYVLALPFLKNTILSDLFYGYIIFFVYEYGIKKKLTSLKNNNFLIRTVENFKILIQKRPLL
jgi:uncharacterized membrane protein